MNITHVCPFVFVYIWICHHLMFVRPVLFTESEKGDDMTSVSICDMQLVVNAFLMSRLLPSHTHCSLALMPLFDENGFTLCTSLSFLSPPSPCNLLSFDPSDCSLPALPGCCNMQPKASRAYPVCERQIERTESRSMNAVGCCHNPVLTAGSSERE
jgi:hypothetical protein